MDQAFAVVTPTYSPDLGRCKLLCESLDRVSPHVPHYLIVDRRDRPAFAHLERGKRRVIESESLIGDGMWRMPGAKGFWLSVKSLPARGWIIQQILKIASIQAVSEQTLVFCDSDTAFFRPFDRDSLLIDGRVGLLDVDFHNEMIVKWTSTARRLLGLPVASGGYRNHVGNMICWDRNIVKALQDRIQSTMGVNWRLALARTRNFSEYMLYGIFVREALGYDNAHQSPSTVPLVKPSWGRRLDSDAAIAAFFNDFDPRTVAVMIHSKDRIDPARYRSHLERLWKMVRNV